MTTSYNRSQVYYFDELNDPQKEQVKNDYCLEDSDCYSNSFVKFNRKNVGAEFIPMDMFIRTNLHGNTPNNFTHGIHSTSAFDGYFITFNRSNDECVIAHKYF